MNTKTLTLTLAVAVLCVPGLLFAGENRAEPGTNVNSYHGAPRLAKVEIVSPPLGIVGHSFSEEAHRKGIFRLIFTARASDDAGNPVTNVTFHWENAGTVMGQGNVLAREFYVPPCTVIRHPIKVTARDNNGSSAVSEIIMSLGHAC